MVVEEYLKSVDQLCGEMKNCYRYLLAIHIRKPHNTLASHRHLFVCGKPGYELATEAVHIKAYNKACA